MGRALGDYLREAREKSGLSQAEVAENLGLKSAQSISNIERGVAPLTQSKIAALARLLKIDPEDIIEIILTEVRGKYLQIIDQSEKRRQKPKGRLATLFAKKQKT